MFVKHFFELPEEFTSYIRSLQTPFDSLGEVIFYRTYSRRKPNGEQETWGDTVIRVVNGVFSVRKNHYIEHDLPWNKESMTEMAVEMALYMFELKFLPAGRGLWAMGTENMYKRGSASLFNCGAVSTVDLVDACVWAMDMLMNGVGVGFDTAWRGKVNLYVNEDSRTTKTYVIPDTREGWVESVRILVDNYISKGNDTKWMFDYTQIRPAGSLIKGFGGIASGASPLIKLHERVRTIFSDYRNGKITSSTRVVADLMNSIGACVVSGNVRRSAEIIIGDQQDETFMNLKNYDRYPERSEIGWMSNNTVVLKTQQDFINLPKIAERVRNNGEPGVMNLLNVQKYGRVRYGEECPDRAFLVNPCGEIPLENKELCNLAEVFPTKCKSSGEFIRALTHATFYTATVSLLPTHCKETNAVIARNRRTGVSLTGIADWLDSIGMALMIRHLRDGYRHVKAYNEELAMSAGVRPSIRVTTVKPSGTISLMAGVSSGIHFPTFKHAIRRIRIAQNSPICKILTKAGVPNEVDVYSDNTQVFEFVTRSSKTRSANEVSAWEQFALLSTLQREWSDNSVSATIYFNQTTEGSQIEHMLAQFAPIIKTVSMLPHSETGSYKQMPYEGISEDEFKRRKICFTKTIDWKELRDSDGIDIKFCTNESCSA